MNKIFRAAAFCLPVLLCFALVSYTWLYYYQAPLLYDVEEYFKQIEGENVTSWWSVLYMYECRWITDLLNIIPGVHLDGRVGMFLINATGSCLLCASFIMVLKHSTRRGALWTLFYSILMCSSIPFLIYNGVNYNSAYLGNLDYPGTTYMTFAVILSLCYRSSMGWKKFLVLSLVLCFIMFHVVSFRKPFILFVPLIALYAIFSQLQKVSLKNCCCALCISVAASVAFYAFSELPSLLPHKKCYPAQHMVMSDLKIASILVGEPDYLKDELMPKIHCELITTDRSFQYAQYAFIGHNLIITSPSIHSDEQWRALRSEYLRYFLQHPMAMLEARAIKILQFFTGNYVPMIVRDVVSAMHPQVKSVGLTYDTFVWPENVGNRLGNIRRLICTLVWIVGFSLPLAFAWSRRKMLGSPQRGQAIYSVVYVGVGCFLAMASYITVIVATVDFRYRIPAVVLAVIALVLWYDRRTIKYSTDRTISCK